MHFCKLVQRSPGPVRQPTACRVSAWQLKGPKTFLLHAVPRLLWLCFCWIKPHSGSSLLAQFLLQQPEQTQRPGTLHYLWLPQTTSGLTFPGDTDPRQAGTIKFRQSSQNNIYFLFVPWKFGRAEGEFEAVSHTQASNKTANQREITLAPLKRCQLFCPCIRLFIPYICTVKFWNNGGKFANETRHFLARYAQ